jgi:hypothetical protein
VELSSITKVADSQPALLEQNVGKLQIPMHDALAMQVRSSTQNLLHDTFGLHKSTSLPHVL